MKSAILFGLKININPKVDKLSLKHYNIMSTLKKKLWTVDMHVTVISCVVVNSHEPLYELVDYLSESMECKKSLIRMAISQAAWNFGSIDGVMNANSLSLEACQIIRSRNLLPEMKIARLLSRNQFRQ